MTGAHLVRSRGFLRLGIPIGIIFLCAGLLGWSAGDTAVPPAAQPAAVAWSLPQVEVWDPGKDLAIVTAGHPWHRGFSSPASAASKAAVVTPSWRLAGIVQRDNQRFALIASGPDAAAKFDYLSIGDPLPDGSVLVEITPDSATVEKEKSSSSGRRVYRLFDKKQ